MNRVPAAVPSGSGLGALLILQRPNLDHPPGAWSLEPTSLPHLATRGLERGPGLGRGAGDIRIHLLSNVYPIDQRLSMLDLRGGPSCRLDIVALFLR